jgi:hypothetical protein
MAEPIDLVDHNTTCAVRLRCLMVHTHKTAQSPYHISIQPMLLISLALLP